MSDPTTGTDHPAASDAHGQAALFLVESLIHALVARSVIGIGDALDILTVAVDARIEVAADRGKIDPDTDAAATLLSAIRRSLRHDAP